MLLRARNALLPVVTLGAVQPESAAVTQLIVVEVVFAYPGMGRLMVDAVEYRDYPLSQGCFLVFTLLAVTLNYAADVLYRRLDLRVGA